MQIQDGRAHKSWNVVVRPGGVSKKNGAVENRTSLFSVRSAHEQNLQVLPFRV